MKQVISLVDSLLSVYTQLSRDFRRWIVTVRSRHFQSKQNQKKMNTSAWAAGKKNVETILWRENVSVNK